MLCLKSSFLIEDKGRYGVNHLFLFWQASLRAKRAHTGVEAVLKPYSLDKKRVHRYEIPQGSWFEWVSCAHYLAEIVRFFSFFPPVPLLQFINTI